MWRAAGPGGSLRWLAFLLLALCPSTAGRAAGEASCRADEGRLRKHVAFLADDSLEGRNAGYPGEARAADYVANQFRALGLRAVSGNSPGNASYFQVFSFTPRVAPEPGSLTAPAPPPDMRACNVLGLLPGADPEREREIVLLGAHHDGQGMEGQTDPGIADRSVRSPSQGPPGRSR